MVYAASCPSTCASRVPTGETEAPNHPNRRGRTGIRSRLAPPALRHRAGGRQPGRRPGVRLVRGPLEAATEQLGLSETFTGLVIVAIASNAVEHGVGIRFALKAKPEYAISTTLNSPLQVALLLTPVLVLLSRVVGPTQLNLVFPPLLVAALAVSTLVVA